MSGELCPLVEAKTALVPNLQEVISKANDAETENRSKAQQPDSSDLDFGENMCCEITNDCCDEQDNAAHCWRPRFDRMAGWSVISDVLANFVPNQPVDKQGHGQRCKQQCNTSSAHEGEHVASP